MGGAVCVIIILGNDVQAASGNLAQTASASCQLVDYLRTEDGWNEEDAKGIEDFHAKAKEKLIKMSADLATLNKALAAKYGRDIG